MITTEEIKSTLKEICSEVEDDNVSVLLSGGIDSRLILYTLMDLGKNITCYTFHMDNVESSDIKISRRLCEEYNLPLVEVELPSDVESIKNYCIDIVNNYGAERKTNIECCYAMYYTLPKIKDKIVFQGIAGELFLDSKKAALHYSQSLELSNELREKSFNNHLQRNIVDKLAEEKKVIRPFYDIRMLNLFKRISFKELNSPRAKGILYEVYTERDNKCYSSNYQKGDSGISTVFEKLMETDWKRGKSVTSIYNALIRGEIPEKKGFSFGI